MNNLQDLLLDFCPISLEEMNAVKLMNRMDTKYLTTRDALPKILSHLKEYYFVQKIEDKTVSHYQTLYYDTLNLQMYLDHHNKKLTRQKLRTRIYCNTGHTFCEIKNKTNKKRTKKKRIAISTEQIFHLFDDAHIVDFIQTYLHYDISQLSPCVQNEFDRITLVNKEKTERVTIDTNISFTNITTQHTAQILDLVIIELKQSAHISSYLKKVLAELSIQPQKISKYCLGTILTHPGVKMNRFKKKLRYLSRIGITWEIQ